MSLFYKVKILPWIFAGLVLLSLMIGGLFWGVNRWLQDHEVDVSNQLTQALPFPIRYEKISLSWAGWHIQVVFTRWQAIDPDLKQVFASADKLLLRLDPIDSFRQQWKTALRGIEADHLKLIFGLDASWKSLSLWSLNQKPLPKKQSQAGLLGALTQIKSITLNQAEFKFISPQGEWHNQSTGIWSWSNRDSGDWEYQGDETWQWRVLGEGKSKSGSEPKKSWTHHISARTKAGGSQIKIHSGKPLHFNLQFQKKEKHWDWEGQAKEIDLGFLQSVLPDLSSTDLVWFPDWATWLQAHLVRGEIEKTQWQHREEKLQGQISFKSVDFSYDVDWPAVTQLTGDLIYENEIWHLKTESARIFEIDTQFLSAKGYDKDEKTYWIEVEGQLQAPLARGLAFIQTSPLKEALGLYVNKLQAQGDMDLDLRLDIPIPEVAAIKVQGKLNLNHAQIRGGSAQEKNTWVLGPLQGRVSFTENSLIAHLPQVNWQTSSERQKLLPNSVEPSTLHLQAVWDKTQKTAEVESQFDANWDAKLKWTAGEFVQGQILISPKAEDKSRWPEPQDHTLSISAPHFECQWVTPLFAKTDGVEKIHFHTLKLPHSDEKGGLIEMTDWIMQPVHFMSDATWFGERFWGKVEVAIHPQPKAWDITNLKIERPHLLLSASGRWDQAEENTVLKGHITSDSLGSLLRDLGREIDLKDGKLSADLNCEWPGSPLQFSPTDLYGSAEVTLEKGRLLGVEPGFARLLGLFSIDNLLRRLRLDFRDVFKRGFIIDSATLHLDMTGHTVEVKDAKVKGPSADLIFFGKTDTKSKTVSLYVTVTPKGSNTVPVAAAMAVNPAFGAGVWVLDKLTGSALSKSQGINYEVTGSWDAPKVKQLPSL